MNYLKNTIPLFLLIGCVFLCVKGCHYINDNTCHQKHNQTRSSEIISLKNSSETTGSFFIGIGSVGETDYYVYYRKTQYGGYMRDKTPTSHAFLYETDYTPKVIESGRTTVCFKDGKPVSESFTADYYGTVTILIPKGTIVEQFKLE